MKSFLRSIKILFAVTLGFTVLLFAYAKVDNAISENEKIEAAEKKAQEEKCRQELACWSENKFFTTSSACQQKLEKLARYDFEWTDAALEPKFSHYRWLDQKAGTVTYIGDKLKFQNGYGAWTHISYECDYDPINETVLDVRAEQGQL